jgi:hypothetical protein
MSVPPLTLRPRARDAIFFALEDVPRTWAVQDAAASIRLRFVGCRARFAHAAAARTRRALRLG